MRMCITPALCDEDSCSTTCGMQAVSQLGVSCAAFDSYGEKFFLTPHFYFYNLEECTCGTTTVGCFGHTVILLFYWIGSWVYHNSVSCPQ